ncbi:penicillin acylase family protein [Virgibacillus sp. LDC-1]|uniref:penicillin acylase family protein n=1 Tax=Virgibacillus sp. LDC-1 TaxID=3039856 RepID=UPI0024DE9CDA|nr:penicillin acylase family protein [Virgibacillus sp. LDC-1]
MEETVQWKASVKKKRKWKLGWIIIGSIVVLCAIAFMFMNGFINRSLPQLEGTIEVPLLAEEVVVITDEHGVPHIKAANEKDLYIAQGYIQAQNRMFQMEMSRRQASGTLSEVVGEAAVDHDKYFRSLGLRRAAEKSYEIYSKEGVEVLKWFAAGVNAYIEEATRENRLPIEFTLMAMTPEKWTPIDSLTIGKYMAFDLGGHWEQQAFNYYLLDRFPEEKAFEIFPAYPKDRPTIIQESEIDIAASFEHAVIPPPFNGSNNWVVSGEKTASGMPMLADDPHLGLATPSIWLQMGLQAEDLNVSGVIFAGVPGIILGHNDKIAWGVTNTGPDVQQLYVEKRNPNNAKEFLYEDEWYTATVIDEPIKVKDGETIPYQVVETKHGPIVSEFAEASGEDTVLSLKWTALEATTELEAILHINRANDWEQFEKGLEKFLAPAQNFVFAAKDGTIAFKANGNIPIYKNGTDALLPLPGWDASKDWQGYIPFDELPRVVNPKKGYIATANNKVTPDNYPYHISNVWAQPYRYERIAEVLESGSSFNIDAMQALQMDTMNLRAREFIPMFAQQLKRTQLSEQEREILTLLTEKWDFHDDANLMQPLVFHHWMAAIDELVYDDIPESMLALFSNQGQVTDNLLRQAAENSSSIWISEKGGLQNVLHEAFVSTIESLTERYGDNVTEWEWGAYHQVQFNHPLSDVNPVLKFFFNRKQPMAVDGSAVTPMAAAFDLETGQVDHGASWRFIIDTANMDEGYHIVGPGQDGHFRSAWYDDQIEDWVNGTYHQTLLKKQGGKKLTLRPRSKPEDRMGKK